MTLVDFSEKDQIYVNIVLSPTCNQLKGSIFATYLFIYLFYLRNQYTKIYERKDRKNRKTGNC